MRCPRMTTRRWMVAVAVVAVMLAAAALFRRHLSLLERGDYHERRERVQVYRVWVLGDLALALADTNPEAAARERAHVAFQSEIRDRHARLKDKYRHAAHYPWLAIEPDPPEPENPFILENLYNEDVPGLP
jgi:hypothetical protein